MKKALIVISSVVGVIMTVCLIVLGKSVQAYEDYFDNGYRDY